jgi:antitoxin (DNA-binding transcriptional repressor) of toxin-antitoxin stability system
MPVFFFTFFTLKSTFKVYSTFLESPMVTYSAKQARSNFSMLLKKAEEGEEIVIIRRGKEIARLGKAYKKKKIPPSLKEFRKTISYSGMPLSSVVSKMREEWR